MKPDNVKIIQISTEPYVWHEANGSMYKTRHEDLKVLGLGDDDRIYRWGKHTIYHRETGYSHSEQTTGWREWIPEV